MHLGFFETWMRYRILSPLSSEAVVRSVRDGTAEAVAVFIGTTRKSFQGALMLSPFLRAFNWCPRSGRDALGVPGVQRTSCEDDDGYLFIRSRKGTRSEHAVLYEPPVFPLLNFVVHHWLGVVPVGEVRSSLQSLRPIGSRVQ